MDRESLKRLTDMPNVGKTMERNFLLLGIKQPADLIGRNPYQLYKELCTVTQAERKRELGGKRLWMAENNPELPFGSNYLTAEVQRKQPAIKLGTSSQK